MKGKKVEKTNLARDDVYGMTSHLHGKMGGFLGGAAPKAGVDRMKRSCVGAFFLENAYSSQKIPKKF